MKLVDLVNEALQAPELQGDIRQNSMEQNSVLAGCGVHWLFRDHIVDLATGKHGIRWAIAKVMTQHNAYAKRGESQDLYLKIGLTTRQIDALIRAEFGVDRYPFKTIEQYLSVIMRKDGQIGSVEMTCYQDRQRHCKRPRYKWYLIAE